MSLGSQFYSWRKARTGRRYRALGLPTLWGRQAEPIVARRRLAPNGGGPARGMFCAARVDLQSGVFDCRQEIKSIKHKNYMNFALHALRVSLIIPSYMRLSCKAVFIDGVALQALHEKKHIPA